MKDTQRKKQRILAPMQLVVGQDDDLINWYLSFPSGHRQQQLKNAIRRGLGMPVLSQTAPLSPTIIHTNGDTGRIKALESELEQLKKQYAYLIEHLEQFTTPAATKPVLEAYDDRLTDERIAERKTRLKKAAW